MRSPRSRSCKAISDIPKHPREKSIRGCTLHRRGRLHVPRHEHVYWLYSCLPSGHAGEGCPGAAHKDGNTRIFGRLCGHAGKVLLPFGSPIYGSPSPTLHNTGFDASGFSGAYFRCDTLDVERVRNEIKRPTFMGASVTIPFKRDVMQFVDTFTKACPRYWRSEYARAPIRRENCGR